MKKNKPKDQTVTASYTKPSFFKSLYWRFYMWQLSLRLALSELKQKELRAKYCRHGYHKLRSESLTTNAYGKGSKTLRWLKCAHCNYLFFVSKRDREKYLKYKQEASTRLQEQFSALLTYPSKIKLKHQLSR